MINTWLARLPSVDEVRPEVCLECEVRHRPGTCSIRGHGLRTRVVLGPPGPGAVPGRRSVRARRYRCSACGCVMIVVPAEVAAHFRYSLSAILWALGLWSLAKLNAGQVRRRVSVNATSGFGDPRLWRSLRRWARRHQQLWPSLVDKARATLRETAQAVVTTLVARCSPAPVVPTAADAWLAAHLG